MTIKQIREGLYQCLIKRYCTKCPYYKWYNNDDIKENGDNSCFGFLQKDADEALLRLEILIDESE